MSEDRLITRLFTFSFIFHERDGRFVAKAKPERDFQSNLIKELESLFPGCIVTKLDSGHIQGIPDLLILWKDRWATLECKKTSHEEPRPNQPYYVDLMNKMSFSRFIFPENKEEVLHELEQAFRSRRKSRLSGSK